jgi:hypothetical protein
MQVSIAADRCVCAVLEVDLRNGLRQASSLKDLKGKGGLFPPSNTPRFPPFVQKN